MPGEWVIDASLVAAILFDEIHTAAARRFLAAEIEDGAAMIAPDLLPIELASITAKKVWLDQVSEADGAAAIDAALRLVGRPVAAGDLVQRAYALSATHRFSAYDAAYLALADARGCRMATLDGRLVRRADQAGLARLVYGVA